MDALFQEHSVVAWDVGEQSSLEHDLPSILAERNPLDERLLRELETELIALTGCQRANRAQITILNLEDYRRAQRHIIPEQLRAAGLDDHFHVLTNPDNPRQVFVGPSALAGLNAGHTSIINDLVYALIAAYGSPTNEAFDRGCADLLAEELAKRTGLAITANTYPREREFVRAIIDATRDHESDFGECVAMLKRNPRQFFANIKNSTFYRWWLNSVKSQNASHGDRYSRHVNLIGSLSSANAQFDGSFLRWAGDCAAVYRNFRLEQRRKALLGAAARRAEGAQGR